MVAELDIHNAVAALLKAKTGMKTYSNEVLEGFKAPCFFCKVSFEVFPANYNTDRIFATVGINYLSGGTKRARDEKEGLQMLTLLRKIFRGQLNVGDRYLFIQKAEGDFVGENSDTPLFSFLLDFFDEAARDEAPKPPMEHVDFTNDITMHIQEE